MARRARPTLSISAKSYPALEQAAHDRGMSVSALTEALINRAIGGVQPSKRSPGQRKVSISAGAYAVLKAHADAQQIPMAQLAEQILAPVLAAASP
jgi:predicted HicB family RNase H-like nuclease